MLTILGEEVRLRARVEVIDGYSAHADRTGLAQWIDAVRRESPELRDVWLVHGEPNAQDAFAQTLLAASYRAHCPTPGTRTTV